VLVVKTALGPGAECHNNHRVRDIDLAEIDNVLPVLVVAVPLRRIAEPEEIVDSILFLASDTARSINGATIDVNGGLVMM
jgi:NAD(P)-dependent dehydrogenase (short-subunit alcohol dehydrogenase family)